MPTTALFLAFLLAGTPVDSTSAEGVNNPDNCSPNCPAPPAPTPQWRYWTTRWTVESLNWKCAQEEYARWDYYDANGNGNFDPGENVRQGQILDTCWSGPICPLIACP